MPRLNTLPRFLSQAVVLFALVVLGAACAASEPDVIATSADSALDQSLTSSTAPASTVPPSTGLATTTTIRVLHPNVGEGRPPHMFAGNIDLDGIDAAEQRWIDSGITDYRFTYKRSCLCTQEAGAPWTVTVRNGQIESVENDDYGTPEQVIDITPERIYELSRMAMGGGDTVVLSVNEYGFPVVGVVGVKSAEVDGGLDFRTSDFEVLS